MGPTRMRMLFMMLLLLLGWQAALAMELPANTPVRQGGSWLIEQVETGNALDIRKTWTICLDTRAERALHEWEARELQADATRHGEHCGEPQPVLSGNMLSWTVRCTATGGADEGSDIRHATTFASSEETRAETIVASHGEPTRHIVTRMKRMDACPARSTPGEMTLLHWRINGEETLKARQRRNLHDEIAKDKAVTSRGKTVTSPALTGQKSEFEKPEIQ